MGRNNLSKRRNKVSKRRINLSNRRSKISKRRNKVSKRKSRLIKYGGMTRDETDPLNTETESDSDSENLSISCGNFDNKSKCNATSNCFWYPSRIPGKGDVCLSRQRKKYHLPKKMPVGKINRKRYDNYLITKPDPLSSKSVQRDVRIKFDESATHACEHKPDWRKVGIKTPRNLILPRFESYYNLIRTNNTYPEICKNKYYYHPHLKWSEDMGYCCGSTKDNKDDFKNYLIFMINNMVDSATKTTPTNIYSVLDTIKGVINKLKRKDRGEVRQLLNDKEHEINNIISSKKLEDKLLYALKNGVLTSDGADAIRRRVALKESTFRAEIRALQQLLNDNWLEIEKAEQANALMSDDEEDYDEDEDDLGRRDAADSGFRPPSSAQRANAMWNDEKIWEGGF